MWLATTRGCESLGIHIHPRDVLDIDLDVGRIRRQIWIRVRSSSWIGSREERMSMRRYLAYRQRNLLNASCFCQDKPVALMNWNSTLKIGKSEG